MDAVTAERLRARIKAYCDIDGVRLDGPRLQRAISRLLSEIDDVTGRWARVDCASNGDRLGTHRDDVHNLVRIEMAEVMRSMIAPPQTAPPQIADLPAYLRRIAMRIAYSYFHSTAVTGLAGGSGAARRSGAIHAARREISIRHGRPASDAEIVDEVNRRAWGTRRDPVKQGALVTVADVHIAPPLSLDALPLDALPRIGFDTDTTGAQSPDAPDGPLERIDAERLIARTIDVCAAVSASLGTAARLWIGDALADPPVIGTAEEVATHMGIAPAAAEDLLSGCRTVASLVASAEFDLASPFG